MGFSFGGLIQGALPAAAGYYRGVTGANQLRRQYANEDAARERRMRLDALQEMLLKGQVDNFAADNARQDLQQQIGAKGSAEGRAIQMAQATKPPVPNEAYQKMIGPQGRGIYGVTEGQEPRFLGRDIPDPVTGTGGGAGASDLPPRGARLIDQPGTGRKVWVHPAYPGKTWDAGADMTTPTAANADITGNERSLQVVRDALAAVTQHPEAFGGVAQWVLPSSVQGIADPRGQNARNPVADIGSLQIKDRSGATVPAAELKRLGFVPDVKDPPEVIRGKLDRLAKWIETESRILQQQYPQARGFSGQEPASLTHESDDPVDAAYQRWLQRQGQ